MFGLIAVSNKEFNWAAAGLIHIGPSNEDNPTVALIT